MKISLSTSRSIKWSIGQWIRKPTNSKKLRRRLRRETNPARQMARVQELGKLDVKTICIFTRQHMKRSKKYRYTYGQHSMMRTRGISVLTKRTNVYCNLRRKCAKKQGCHGEWPQIWDQCAVAAVPWYTCIECRTKDKPRDLHRDTRLLHTFPVLSSARHKACNIFWQCRSCIHAINTYHCYVIRRNQHKYYLRTYSGFWSISIALSYASDSTT